MLLKRKRIKNPELLKSYRNLPCDACGTTIGTVGHHIRSVGAGGPDIPENLLALCFEHHNIVHSKGLSQFTIEYPLIATRLLSNGWSLCEDTNRWFCNRNLFQ